MKLSIILDWILLIQAHMVSNYQGTVNSGLHGVRTRKQRLETQTETEENQKHGEIYTSTRLIFEKQTFHFIYICPNSSVSFWSFHEEWKYAAQSKNINEFMAVIGTLRSGHSMIQYFDST